MYAKDMDEEEAAAWLDDGLADVGTNGKKRTTKTKATAAV